MVVTLPGPPSPSTSTSSIMPTQALVKMDTSPENATFHSSSTDTATGYSSVTLPTTIVATSKSVDTDQCRTEDTLVTDERL